MYGVHDAGDDTMEAWAGAVVALAGGDAMCLHPHGVNHSGKVSVVEDGDPGHLVKEEALGLGAIYIMELTEAYDGVLGGEKTNIFNFLQAFRSRFRRRTEAEVAQVPPGTRRQAGPPPGDLA